MWKQKPLTSIIFVKYFLFWGGTRTSIYSVRDVAVSLLHILRVAQHGHLWKNWVATMESEYLKSLRLNAARNGTWNISVISSCLWRAVRSSRTNHRPFSSEHSAGRRRRPRGRILGCLTNDIVLTLPLSCIRVFSNNGNDYGDGNGHGHDGADGDGDDIFSLSACRYFPSIITNSSLSTICIHDANKRP